jgi:hypothetical protein
MATEAPLLSRRQCKLQRQRPGIGRALSRVPRKLSRLSEIIMATPGSMQLQIKVPRSAGEL